MRTSLGGLWGRNDAVAPVLPDARIEQQDWGLSGGKMLEKQGNSWLLGWLVAML